MFPTGSRISQNIEVPRTVGARVARMDFQILPEQSDVTRTRRTSVIRVAASRRTFQKQMTSRIPGTINLDNYEINNVNS